MNDTIWVEETSLQAPVCKKRKRRVGKRKIEFVGWGSRPLIEFLEAIGKDTREKHPRQEVAAFISKYINDKGLTSAEKKKKVLCDERLYALFGKKSMSRIKVYDMLEEHFAENHDDSDDESLDSSDEDHGEKNSLKLKKIPTGQIKKVLKTPKSCYAAVTPENIKLIYLKRSVIQELLKFPESFEFKIVGSFVRMKSDPNDIYQKNRFQLQHVTGIEKTSGTGNADIQIHLRVSNFFKDVAIGMLSDDNFTKEEVEDVWDRIKAGSLNRLTINEVQSKAQVLHVDITNNWIVKEISLLQKLAEHANEKGWQREKFEYLERRKMLQKPSEQEKLLLKLPEVVAEELELEATVTAASEKAEISACSPKSILRGSSDVSSTDASGSGEIGTPPKVNLNDSHANGLIDWVIDVPLKDPKGSGEIGSPPKVILSDSPTPEVQNGGIHWVADIPLKDPKADIIKHGMPVDNASCGESSRETHGIDSGEKDPHGGEPEQPLITTGPSVIRDENSHGEDDARGRVEPEQPLVTTPIVILDENSTATQVVMGCEEKNPQPPRTAMVIELSDDDSEDDALPESAGRNRGQNPNDAVWYYTDPRGQTQGPFPLYLLKRWSDANYFPSGFTVWRSGQTSHDGVVLADVLHRTFPC